MKTPKEFIAEAKAFNQKEFDKDVDEALKKMWKAYNELETMTNYLRQTGQGGMVTAWNKKIKPIENALNKFD